MDFIDREEELRRLRQLSQANKGGFVVVYGRRRIGKSSLLMKWSQETNGLYWVSDTSSAAIQRQTFALSIATRFPGFDEVVYPTWQALLNALALRAKAISWHGPVVFDEFPYLVASDSTIPGIFQAWIDSELQRKGLLVVISGSSQHMMQGLALQKDSPLYGRAQAILPIAPIAAGFMKEALHLTSPLQVIKAYSIWGGIPRYWQAAEPFSDNLDDSLEELVFNPLGLFHEEPNFLLQSEIPSAISLRPYLDAIGFGAHRMSELASRLQQPTTALSRPIARLIELGLIKKDIPFGESEHNSKKTLYSIAAPFCHFWFHILALRRAIFENTTKQGRLLLWHKYDQSIFAFQWEELARKNVHRCTKLLSKLHKDDLWLPAKRWWQENYPEWDIISTNLDGNIALLGEVKWSEKTFTSLEIKQLTNNLLSRERPRGLPQNACFVLLLPSVAPNVRVPANICLLTAEDILNATPNC